MAAPRVTEQSNPLSRRLGSFSHNPLPPSANSSSNFQFGDGFDAGAPLDALGVLRVLSSCDSQLFTGSDGLPSMHCDGPITAAARCAEAITKALRSGGAIIFAGCGTSGRLAHLLAFVYNQWWRSINRPKGSIELPFDYCLAGGDAALLVPAESVEDSPETGASDLQKRLDSLAISPDCPHVVIGISCGLSAMYVAGVLRFALTRPGAFAVAIGFNDLSAVATVSVPGTGPRFYDVLKTLESNPSHGVVLNPVVGAEAVAGSSRMKGGSATWILCTAMVEVGAKFAIADDNVRANHPLSKIIAQLRGCFVQAEVAIRSLYSLASPALARVLNSAANSLCTPAVKDSQSFCISKRYITPTTSGRIFYVGSDSAGLLGLIDASEATDTYGSRFNDVRAFTIGGWNQMSVREGMKDPVIPPELRGMNSMEESSLQLEFANPNLKSFIEDFVPTLNSSDCVVALWIDSSRIETEKDETMLLEALTLSAEAGAAVHAIIVHDKTSHFSTSVRSLDRMINVVDIVLPYLSMETSYELPGHQTINNINVDDKVNFSVPVLGILTLKLSLNSLTTGAHVSKGVIVGNVMGNMMLTNHKLYLRAIGIVSSLARCSADEARSAILRTVYNTDEAKDIDALLSAEEKDANMVHQHVARASITPLVIPTALLLAAPKIPGLRDARVSDVRMALEKESRVGRALSILYSILAEK